MKEKELRYWVALNQVEELGPVKINALLKKFGEPHAVFGAARSDLLEIDGMTRVLADRIKHFSHWDRIVEEIDSATKLGAKIITIYEKEYPEILKKIYDPPPILYCLGELKLLQSRCIAIVGSRKPTAYGRESARRFARELAGFGFTIVSGFAAGIDSESHRAALESGGGTIAVLGSGIDIIYPKHNEKLYDRISERGLAISEFPLGFPPFRKNFPRRNRIISGLSIGAIVVEATLQSGSLITASFAAEQGRDVFAVPGMISSGTSRGCHKLIKEGAKLVETTGDVMEEIDDGETGARKKIQGEERKSFQIPRTLDDNSRTVIEILKNGKMHIDMIIRDSNMTSSSVTGILTRLEIEGLVRQLPGKVFELRAFFDG